MEAIFTNVDNVYMKKDISPTKMFSESRNIPNLTVHQVPGLMLIWSVNFPATT